MENGIKTLDDIEKLIRESPALLLYISTSGCHVCRELKPKIIKLLAGHFPGIRFQFVDPDLIKEVPGRFSVFTVPVILVFFEGKEFFREGRNLGIDQFRSQLERPYRLFFDQK